MFTISGSEYPHARIYQIIKEENNSCLIGNNYGGRGQWWTESRYLQGRYPTIEEAQEVLDAAQEAHNSFKPILKDIRKHLRVVEKEQREAFREIVYKK